MGANPIPPTATPGTQHTCPSPDTVLLIDGLLHDLANPLTVVSLNLEALLANLSSDHPSRETWCLPLGRMQQAVTQMEQYLQAARHQAHGQDTAVWFEPALEIEQALVLFRHRAKELGIELQFCCATLDVMYGSPVQFARVITNLISNAIDAYDTESNPKPISLVLSTTNQTLTLVVTDHGRGIPPENLPYLCEPFFTTKHSGQGSGMGLAIIKEIVEHHFAGRIHIASKLGKGTSMTIELPKRRKQNIDVDLRGFEPLTSSMP